MPGWENQSRKTDDDSEIGRRAVTEVKNEGVPADRTASVPGKPVEHFGPHEPVANLCSNCKCGHCSMAHGYGTAAMAGSECGFKGCTCSGFSQTPGQGYGWQYQYPK